MQDAPRARGINMTSRYIQYDMTSRYIQYDMTIPLSETTSTLLRTHSVGIREHILFDHSFVWKDEYIANALFRLSRRLGIFEIHVVI